MSSLKDQISEIFAQIAMRVPDAKFNTELMAGLRLVSNPEGINLAMVSEFTQLKALRARLLYLSNT